MATTRKPTAAAVRSQTLKSLDLTKPKSDDSGKLMVEGFEKLAAEYRDAEAEIEELKEAQAERRDKLIAECAKRRLAEEKAGRFYKTCTIATDDEEAPLQLSWGDRYKTLDVSHEKFLRQVFGSKDYEYLFDRTLAVKLGKEATLQAIKDVVGETRFEQLTRYLTFTEQLKLRAGFMERRAGLRESLDARRNDDVDTVVAQVQHEPSLKRV